MKNTVPTAVSDRAVTKDALDTWVNKEARPLLQEARRALNTEAAQVATLTTAATGAFANIWTSDPVPTDSSWSVHVRVLGQSTAGAAQTADYGRVALFRNTAGTLAQVGATQALWSIETAAAMDVRLQVSGQTVTLDVRDDGVSTIAWKAHIRILPTDEQ